MQIGKAIGRAGVGGRGSGVGKEYRFGPRPPTSARGFTLLELMIVISIIIVLAMVVMPQYNRFTLQARETALRDNLFQMRKMIDQYAADKGKMAQSLDELVSANYLRDIPIDPITGERDWIVEMGEDVNAIDGGQGVSNVCSSSSETASDGSSYNDCTKW
ncbi:MAG: type II secretion system GspH family protein [Acidobacteriota bacterium]|nr:type II secretion system GspH family protein [Acidobacteriota bacterium]